MRELGSCREAFCYSLYKTASFFTDPVCEAHRAFWMQKALEVLQPNSSFLEKNAKKVVLLAKCFFFALLASVTTIPAIGLRKAAISVQQVPYFLEKGEKGKVLQERKIVSFFWNVCGAPAGYSMTDAGVIPIYQRMDRVVEKILEQKADVVGLCEVFDIDQEDRLIVDLKNKDM